MLKRILRAGLGVIFFFVFLAFLLVGAVRFRLLNPGFWKTALENGMVYEQLHEQLRQMIEPMREEVGAKAGGIVLPKEISALIALDETVSQEKLKELIETNIDRAIGYMNGQQAELTLFLPIKEWGLPVAAFGQPALANLTGETRVEDALSVSGMKQEQVDQVLTQVKQFKGIGGLLVWFFVGAFLLTAGLLAGHYFLGMGQTDRLSGTAWLLMVSGLVAKLIGVGAGRIFELFATAPKSPLPIWGAELGRSLVGQFFDLGANIGLLVGLIGLGGIVAVMILSKQGKIKEEKEKMGFFKRVAAFILGVTLGFLVLGLAVAGIVLAFGGSVNLSVGGSSFGAGSQSGAGQLATQAMKEEAQRLSDDVYKSEKGWQIQFPTGWEVIKDKESEGVMKKPTGSVTNWATIEIGETERMKEVDSGEYLAMMKRALGSATGFKNAVLAEEPFEERQDGGSWRRFVFVVDYDGVIAEQPMRLRLYSLQYFPAENGDGFVIMARVPVESWGRYEKIIKESVDTFVP